MNDFEEPRRNALRALREMIPPELTRVMVEADFAGRYEQVCERHPPRLQSLAGSQRHAAALALQGLGTVHRSPGGNHAITVADQPAGMVFEVSWRADTRVEAFLSLSEAELRCGSNFAILTHAARTHPVSPGKPTHPRPYAADGDELHAVVAELLALAV
ncbi:MAG TPA: hypothetical protein VLI06_20590, partial [Solimonas sp.]|nr:hypothetical protein [Solimonas sp.]